MALDNVKGLTEASSNSLREAARRFQKMSRNNSGVDDISEGLVNLALGLEFLSTAVRESAVMTEEVRRLLIVQGMTLQAISGLRPVRTPPMPF